MSSSRPTRYAQSLPFLLSQVGARSAQLFAERLASVGVSPRAYGVLSNLAAGPTQTQQQLADALGIHRNNMVGLIDEMEAAGWLRRHRSAEDRRAFDIRLTRAGLALVTKVDKLLPALEDELRLGLTDGEQQTLVTLLSRLAQTLELRPGIHPHLATPSGGVGRRFRPGRGVVGG